MRSNFNAGRIRVYSLECCPHCEELKEALKKEGVPFDEVDMQDPEWITEMRVNGCFAMEAPVVQMDEEIFLNFYEAMGRLKEMR